MKNVKTLLPVILGLGLFVLLSTGIGGIAGNLDGARSFTLESIVVDADVRPDGSMEVVEQVTYDFDGEYSVGTRSFEASDLPPNLGGYEIVDVEATEGGEPRLPVTDTSTLFEWQLGADGGTVSGTHTYQLTYTVIGAVQVFSDVGELEWKWIGFEQPAVERFEAQVTMPGNGEGLRAWGHGPANGEVSDPDGPTVTFTVDDVPAGAFVESRIIVPASVFTVEPTGPPMAEEIIAEEEQRAQAANDERDRQEAAAEREALARGVLTVATALLVPLALLVFWLLWRRWGKEPPRPDDVGEYWREVPDDPPAVAVALRHFGGVDEVAFAATAVDLAQRGLITITEEEKDKTLGIFGGGTEYRFRRTDQPAEGLLPFETTLLATLFRGGDLEITQSELVSWARSNQSTSTKRWERFKREVGAELRKRRYVNQGRVAPFLTPILMGVGLVGLAVLDFVTGAWPAGIVAAAGGVLVLLLTVLMRQRTPAGARTFAMWDGLGRFLEDFSRLGDDDVRVADEALYERYLVAAVAWGVADKLVEGLRLKVPEVADDPGFAPWYVGRRAGMATTGGIASMGGIGTFASHFGGAATSAFTPRSSGSGTGGGGFSSGGGGGGGGGGFGAR